MGRPTGLFLVCFDFYVQLIASMKTSQVPVSFYVDQSVNKTI